MVKLAGVSGDVVPKSVEGAIDWFSCTTRNELEGFKLYDAMLKTVRENKWDKLGMKDWTTLGYQGLKWEHGFWGVKRRPDEWLFIASGEAAKKVWFDLFPFLGRVTRMDYAVTVELKTPVPKMAEMIYKYTSDVNPGRTYTLITCSRGGGTVYVGSRHSEQFGRFYDKGVQAGVAQEGEVWRYEVSVKKPRAGTLAERLFRMIEGGGVTSQLVGSYVHEWFSVRGIKPMFNPDATEAWGVCGSVTVTTPTKKLDWLRSQVRPTINLLLLSGYKAEVLEALGLKDEQTPMEFYF